MNEGTNEQITLLHHFALSFIVTILIRSSFNSHNQQHHSPLRWAINITRKTGDRCQWMSSLNEFYLLFFVQFCLLALSFDDVAVVVVVVVTNINSFAFHP